MIADQISTAYFHLEAFSDLQFQAIALGNMQRLYGDEISTPSKFPPPYKAAILKFEFHDIRVSEMSRWDLAHAFHASPPMRAYHRRRAEADPTTHVKGVSQHFSFRDNSDRVRVNWLLERLWLLPDGEHDELLSMVGFTHIIDELQRLIDVEPAKSMISSHVASLVGDLAITSECLHQLELYLPWMNTIDAASTAQKASMEQVYTDREERWSNMLRGIDEDDSELGATGRPTDGKFAYPIAIRRTRENVEAMRSAERNLDLFWHKVDQDMESKSSAFVGGVVHRLLTQDRRLQRTPEWIEPVRANAQPSIEELYIPFSQLLFDHQESKKRTQHGSSGPLPKEKIKTRKLGYAQVSAAEARDIIAPAEAQGEPHFTLNARALKVFKTLFFTHSMTSTPGEVAWADFLYAMVSVGFAPEKLYGSVWQFRPDPAKVDAERSIQFHEPHGGDSKIPYRIARRHGRRLNRAYGWHGSTFMLEEKSKQK